MKPFIAINMRTEPVRTASDLLVRLTRLIVLLVITIHIRTSTTLRLTLTIFPYTGKAICLE
jgi:hypothetical protein